MSMREILQSNWVACALLVLGAFSPGANAQDAAVPEGLGFEAGPFRFVPSLGLTYSYDDNVARTAEFEQGTHFHVVSPGIRVELPTRNALLSLTWEYDFGRYRSYSIGGFDYDGLDDYDDRLLALDLSWSPTSRHRIEAWAMDVEGHDDRGVGSRQGFDALEPIPVDTWEESSVGARWEYGGTTARGRLTLDAGLDQREYTNNPDYTSFRSYDSRHLGAGFDWRVRSRLRLGVGVDSADFSYDTPSPSGSLDSDQLAYFLTAGWDVGTKTSGTVRLGRQRKDFDDPLRGGQTNAYWQVEANWRPKTYSELTLGTSSQAQETEGFGDYIQRREYRLGWRHEWLNRLDTTLEAGVYDEAYQNSDRQDDTTWWGVSGRWQISRHLQVGAGWKYHDRDSNDSIYSYEQNVYTVTLEGSL